MRREGQVGGKKARVEEISTERREKEGEDRKRTEMSRKGRRLGEKDKDEERRTERREEG